MPIPPIPANFYVASGNGRVYLSWDASTGAIANSTAVVAPSTGAYDIFLSTDNITYSQIASMNNTSYYYDPTTGVLAYYKVRANGNTGASLFTTPIAVTAVNYGLNSLGAIRFAAQQRADMVNNDFVTKQEWNDYINHSYHELYDILVQTYSDEYYVATAFTFTTDARSPALYDLPVNLYKLLGVDLGVSPNNNAFVTLKKFAFISRNRYIYGNTPVSFLGTLQLRYRLVGNQLEFVPNPQANQQIKLWYIPRPTILLADSDCLDGISGWDEYVIVDAAIKAMQKEESDVSVLMAQKQALMVRITAAASNRDVGQSECATDMRRLDGGYWSDPFGDGPQGGW